jgi:hypothetical protein
VRNSAIKAWFYPLFISAFFALIIYLLRSSYDLFGLSDALLFPGIFNVGIVLLRLIARTGTYDVAGYGVTSFRDAFRREGKKNFQSVYDYREKQTILRKNKPYKFWPSLMVGVIFIVCSFLIAEVALME